MSDVNEPPYDDDGYRWADEPVVDSQAGDDPGDDEAPLFGTEPEGKRRRGCALPGCLAVLVALALLAGGAYFGLSKGLDSIMDRFSDPEDYAGPGTGHVLVEVKSGDTGADIGNTLKGKGVVKSVDAFTEALLQHPDESIQAGFYEMQKQMKAADAAELMLDPANQLKDSITFPEGLRVSDVVDILVDKTKIKRAAFEKALDNPDSLGLPTYANGDAEGYLFPDTYGFPPDATPTSMLKTMVDRWKEVAAELDLKNAAAAIGLTPTQAMIVASLVEAEAPPKYMPKVARVIFNRLDNVGEGPTYGLLQLDATVNFAHGTDLGARTTEEERQIDSPYNTYKYAGLPPGPIEAPGKDAIAAALHPADGPWYFYTTVNLATGETKFAVTLEEQNQLVEELDEYCRTQSERC